MRFEFLRSWGSSDTNYQSFQDEYRLPEGMKRVGYDADSGKYFFRDKEGHIWEGQEGAQFGELTRGTHVVSTIPNNLGCPDIAAAVSDVSAVAHGDGDDVENGPRRADGYAPLPGDAVRIFPYP